MHSKRILGVTIFAFMILFATLSAIQPRLSTEALVKLDPNLLALMEEEENAVLTAAVLVAWNPNLEPIKFNSDAVLSELRAEASRTQAPVITYLEQKRDVQILNTFWINNMILIKAEEETIRELATLTTVEKVLVNFIVTVPQDKSPKEIGSAATAATWNIQKVRAPEVWDNLGLTGEGIKFATTDSGVDITHQDLVGTLFTADPTDPKYPGGWIEYDGNGNPIWSTPHDSWQHGTATYGVIVGDAKSSYGAIGMAPGAKGMSALSLPGGSGTFAQVIAGLQWVLDPYDQAGNHYPPPRVSSHSWGATGYYSELITPIRNMWYSGHFVAAAAGNDYEGYSSTPGNIFETVSAGMTDSGDWVDPQSSGEIVYKTDFAGAPADWPDSWVVPDVSAPGVDVIVPVPGNGYIYWGGTSFASPHVGGAAVLMLSGNPSLTPPEIEAALKTTAVWYDRYYPSKPDTRYGWGRIDAYEATMQVALPQGIVGTVTDTSGQPINNVKVNVIEAGRVVYTDANGYYEARLQPGMYTVEFSRFGYQTTTVPNVAVSANQFTTVDVELTMIPPGYLSGYAYHGPTAIGIPGALVEALDVPVPVQAETGVDGAYTLPIPAGTYDFKASAYGFKEAIVEDVVIVQGATTAQDFNLVQPAAVAVVGDYPSSPGGKIEVFLKSKGYSVDSYTTLAATTPNVPKYSTIIVNRPTGSSTGAEVRNFIAAADANGVGVLWLDSWASYTGGYLLYYSLSPRWPPYRYTSYSSSIRALYYKVTATDSDIIPGWNIGDKIIHDDKGVDKDHAYYTGIVNGYNPNIGTIKVLASIGRRYATYDYDVPSSQGIIKVVRPNGNTKWMLLSMHANTPWTYVDYWTDDTKAVFLNSIEWVAKPHTGVPKFALWNLKVEPKVGLWSEPRTVSVGIKNIGWITGTETFQMYVDTTLEGTATVTLAPGYYAYPSWTVSRFDAGTYKVSVKHLSTTFTVRAPKITVQAYEYNTNVPLAGADVYGYYRTYSAPGWQEQWSYAYGGNGHSQHAQPVGDIDEDGVNEIIVGGYEVSPSWGRARILSYDAGLGTYVEEYTWTYNTGTYHSPSGSTILDLDGDGDLEFVVSWSYADTNDGAWAYDWDGTTLTTLDHWYGGFMFDVYSGDYDDDGYKEVLVANAPWGVTPYHVVALGWQSGHFVEEAHWNLGGSASAWEAPMLWTGDTDNDGKTEVIVSISDGSAQTAGTWALNWASGAWTAEPVYTALIGGGTHYGVVVGEVDGDGTPEIGIGNNLGSYVGAAAVLIEWDGTAYTKVWEGSWPSEDVVIEALAIGDADNDGHNEFVAGGGYVHLIGWTGTGYAEEATIAKTAGLLAGTIIGDTDSDGKNEIKACDIIGRGPGKEWIFKYSSAPLPGASWNLKYFGTTDSTGKLVFDSPASVVDMYLFVYRQSKTPLGWQYLLTKYGYFDDDATVVYKPMSTTEGIVSSKPNARGLELYQHLGVTWLQYDGLPIIWPFTSFKTNPTKIVVTPQIYAFRHMLNFIDPFGSWWYYFMNPDRIAALSAGQTYTYSFAGPIQGYVQHTQTGNSVAVEWNAWDGFGHQITGISVDEVSWLTSGTGPYIPVPIMPSMLGDVETNVGETIDYYPLIAFYDNKKNLITSGYVQWYEKTAQITTTKTVYYAVLNFVSGPYGNPNAKMYVTVIVEQTP